MSFKWCGIWRHELLLLCCDKYHHNLALARNHVCCIKDHKSSRSRNYYCDCFFIDYSVETNELDKKSNNRSGTTYVERECVEAENALDLLRLTRSKSACRAPAGSFHKLHRMIYERNPRVNYCKSAKVVCSASPETDESSIALLFLSGEMNLTWG